MQDRSITDSPVAVNKLVRALYFGLPAVLVMMISCVTIPIAMPKKEIQIRLYPHTVNSEGGVVYHVLCEIYENSHYNETRSSFFNNAVIRVNNHDLHLDEGFVETHRGENYEDYVVDGRFLYIGDELVLDSDDEVRFQMIHPAIGKVERILKTPMSVRTVRVDNNQLALWLAGEITTLRILWRGENADRYQIVVLALLPNGQAERTVFETSLEEAQITRTQLKLPTGFDFSAHRLEIEVIARNGLELDIEGVHFVWRIESPFARRLIMHEL